MRTWTVRTGAALGFLSLYGSGMCQTAPPAQDAAAAYLVFFLDVTAWKQSAEGNAAPVAAEENPGVSPGEHVSAIRASAVRNLENLRAMGIGGRELDAVLAIARSCNDRLSPLASENSRLLFEARLAGVDSLPVPAPVEQRMKEVASRRDQVMRDHIQQLKTALGDSVFQKLDSWVKDFETELEPGGSAYLVAGYPQIREFNALLTLLPVENALERDGVFMR